MATLAAIAWRPARAGAIAIAAAGAKRIGSVDVSRSEILVKGSQDERAADGSLLRSKKIDERYPLPALD